MPGNHISGWVIVLGLALLIPACLAIAGIAGWRVLMRYFVRRYYQDNYHPDALSGGEIGDYPVQHHLDDVPWLSTGEALCQSNSLQMIAAQRGIEEPRRYFDFLMGFTYGATQVPGGLAFFPGTDPEIGFEVAASYLGMKRRFYVTDDRELYLHALRSYLAQGYPVRVGLDMSVLYDLEEELPHSEVLVGYDREGFAYYETVCLPAVPCEPGQRAAGEQGLYVAEDKLLDAVQGQAEMFDYGWRYSLTIFEEAPLVDDLGPVWKRNGQALLGGAKYGPRQGADAVDNLAAAIEKGGPGIDVSEIRPGLEVAAHVRRENAAYLREAFPGEPDLEQVASLFDHASGEYHQVLDAIEDGIEDQGKALGEAQGEALGEAQGRALGEAQQIAARLHGAATAEREAGGLLLRRGE